VGCSRRNGGAAEQAFKFRLLLEQTLCRWPKELVMATVAVTPLKTDARRWGGGGGGGADGVLLGSPERHAILRIMIYLPLGRRWQPRPPLPPTRRAVGFNSI